MNASDTEVMRGAMLGLRLAYPMFKIGITFGAFDVMHFGYHRLINDARLNCDFLVVGIHENPKLERPEKHELVHTLEERVYNLSTNMNIDFIVGYQTEDDLITILKSLRPDIRFLGDDYIDRDYTGKGLCNTHFVSRDHGWSTTKLRTKIFLQECEKQPLTKASP